MAYIRRNIPDDWTWNRAWTADTTADLADIPAKHGDVAYVTADGLYYTWRDNDTWESSSGGGSSWIPLVDGSEPPNFITDGSGHLILVAYP